MSPTDADISSVFRSLVATAQRAAAAPSAATTPDREPPPHVAKIEGPSIPGETVVRMSNGLRIRVKIDALHIQALILRAIRNKSRRSKHGAIAIKVL